MPGPCTRVQDELKLAVLAWQEQSQTSDGFSSGQLHGAATNDTRTVSFMEQLPATDTELLEWSAPQSSLKH